MGAQIIDGKKIAEDIRRELKAEVAGLKDEGLTPGLAVIIVGNDPASLIYVKNKKRAADEVGINSQIYELPSSAAEEELVKLVRKLNDSPEIHGVLIQLPLPEQISEQSVIAKIDPCKDVDCFHAENIGNIMLGGKGLTSCTPQAVVELLERSGHDISGRHAVVVGRSNIVGKPLAFILLQRDATVTIAHSKTKNLADICRTADILISAVGKPGLIKKDMVKSNAVVIDVGINRLPDGKLVGDVDFDGVKEVAGAITPVPGGVGPMTIAMLMRNTVQAAKQLEKSEIRSTKS